MKKLIAYAVLVVAFVLVPVWARAGLFSDSWRYRMTVTVETPEGLKTGSAVREIVVHKGIHLLPEMTNEIDVEGEAVVVDLGKRGVLFATLRGVFGSVDYRYRIAFDLFPPEKKVEIGSTATLSPSQYPQFVHFKDLKDPSSVQAVLETGTVCCKIEADHFEDIFGKGTKIKDITLELTDDPVTTGVSKWLPWLVDAMTVKKDFKDWVNSRNPFPQSVKLNYLDLMDGE